jgi:hypothetical protein
VIRSHDDYFPAFFDLEGNRLSPFLASDQMVAKTNGHPFTIVAAPLLWITRYRDNILPV